MDQPLERRTVLVVEDAQATRAFLLDNLTADGFQAAGASGAGEGLRAIEVRRPSLVVLDLGLEDGSGLRCSTAPGRRTGWPRAWIPRPAGDRAERPGRGCRPRAQLRPRGPFGDRLTG
ncbi:MAG: hypothetical protein H0T69_07550 [Thermoleophilaceae bacterium]|nr:hypothetical protein [Thermoleophilaceae bacterium]